MGNDTEGQKKEKNRNQCNNDGQRGGRLICEADEMTPVIVSVGGENQIKAKEAT